MPASLVSKAADTIRNSVRTVTDLVRRSPWVAAVAVAVLVMLFLA